MNGSPRYAIRLRRAQEAGPAAPGGSIQVLEVDVDQQIP